MRDLLGTYYECPYSVCEELVTEVKQQATEVMGNDKSCEKYTFLFLQDSTLLLGLSNESIIMSVYRLGRVRYEQELEPTVTWEEVLTECHGHRKRSIILNIILGILSFTATYVTFKFLI